jgi:hypothetical protein
VIGIIGRNGRLDGFLPWLKPGCPLIKPPKDAGRYVLEHMRYLEYEDARSGSMKAAANPWILAYLSIAIESSCNILACSEDPDTSKSLLRLLVGLIPYGESAIVIEKERHTIDARTMQNSHQMYGSRYYNVTALECMQDSLKARPGWLILDEICRNEARAVFSSMSAGTHFMSALKCNEYGPALMHRLMANPMKVDPETLNSLDISMRIDRLKNSILLYEYKWLSRAEIEEGIDVAAKDMFEVKEMQPGNPHFTEKSKVLIRYRKLTGMSASESVRELEKRSKRFAKTR